MIRIFTKINALITKHPYYLVGMLSVVFFLIKFDISVLNFTNTDWVYRLSFDPGSELIAFNNFRHTPWHFPIIGQLEGGDYPTVTGIGMTQSVAWLGVLFKTISNWLPVEFQYFGLWYLLCFMLQGWFGLKLIKNIDAAHVRSEMYDVRTFRGTSETVHRSSNIVHQLATLFLLIAPPFLFRTGHIVLFCHFFILAALSLYFSSEKSEKKFIYALLLMFTSAGVSQYMAAMTLSILGMSFIDMAIRKTIPVYKVFLYGFSCLGVAVLVFYMMGATLIPSDNYQTYGFGVFSSNLNTFFNPLSNSTFLPALPLSNSAQYEGFGYLGLGFIVLSLFVICYSLFVASSTQNSKPKSQIPKLSPLISIMFLFFIYALSCKIGWNGKEIFEWQYGSGSAFIFETLRGSGRFIWIPFYILMVLGFIGFFKMKASNTLKTSLLSFCLLIQVIDIKGVMTLDKTIFDSCKGDDCPHLKWRNLFKEASRVVMFPPYSWDFKRTNDFYPFCRAASLEGKAITTGYFARRHTALVKDYETKLYTDWALGNLTENDKAIFIGKKEKLWRLQKLVASGQLQCFEYEGYAVLVPPVLKNTLAYLKQLPNCRPLAFQSESVAEFLEKNKNNTVFITVSEEATYKLDTLTKRAFQKMGATEFAKLGYAGSYMGIFHKGKMLFEKVSGQGENIEKSWKIGETLRGGNSLFTFTENVKLVSRGDVLHKMSKTVIGDKEHSPFRRGLNLVVVDDKFRVIETSYFDTYEETIHALF
jgi:hypothetical protein